MGNRTNQINQIREQKNHIVKVYTELCKNNSSCFDVLAVSYGKNLSKIVSTFGSYNFDCDVNQLSNRIALDIAKQLYKKEFVPMEVYSSICTKKNGLIKQQKYIVLANRNVDRKRKFDFDDLTKNIDNNNMVLLNVKEREILPITADILDKVDEKTYNDQVIQLLFKMMPTIETLGKKQNAVIMQELKTSNPEMYDKIVEMEKKVAQSLFLYETSREQLLLNDAIEEFQTKLWKLPVDIVKENQNGILNYKSKAERIELMMNSNENILKNIETKSQQEISKNF